MIVPRFVSLNSHASMIIFGFLIVLLCLSNKLSNVHSITIPQSKDVWEPTHGKIIFSAVVFRHGDRYPLENPFTGSNPSEEWTPTSTEHGELTKKGKNRTYQLGRWLRQRYNHLINDQPYNSSVLNMLSSHTDRIIMSGQLLLAGLYPPVHKIEEWNKDIFWQPIPVYPLPENDRMIDALEPCPRYNMEMEHMKDDPEISEFYQSHKETLNYIKEKSHYSLPYKGIDPKIESLLIAAFVYSNLDAWKEMGWNLPEWSDKIYIQPLRNQMGTMAFKLISLSHEMKRLKGGPIMGHIIEELKTKRNNAESKKLFQFYSANDILIVTLLNTLGVLKEDNLPGYCSTMLFELRKLKEDYIVTVAYKGQDAPLELMKIPKAPEPCTLDDFIELTKDFIPEDWDTECQSFAPH